MLDCHYYLHLCAVVHLLCGLKQRIPKLGTCINKHFRCATFLWSVYIFLNELGDTFSTSERRTVAAGACAKWPLADPAAELPDGLFVFDEDPTSH